MAWPLSGQSRPKAEFLFACGAGRAVAAARGEASPFYRLKDGSSSLQTKDERKIMALRACLDKKSLVSS
jgi:hypothetical protein